jgi:hypothetical protein
MRKGNPPGRFARRRIRPGWTNAREGSSTKIEQNWISISFHKLGSLVKPEQKEYNTKRFTGLTGLH